MLTGEMKAFIFIVRDYVRATELDNEEEEYLSVGEAIDGIYTDIVNNEHLFTSGLDKFVTGTIMKYIKLDTEKYTDDDVMELIIDFIDRWERIDDASVRRST